MPQTLRSASSASITHRQNDIVTHQFPTKCGHVGGQTIQLVFCDLQRPPKKPRAQAQYIVLHRREDRLEVLHFGEAHTYIQDQLVGVVTYNVISNDLHEFK